MSTSLPYQPPAGGWRSNRVLGGCFQHWRTALAHTPIRENLTRVFNWLCDGEDGWVGSIPPYTRYDSAGALYAPGNPNCAVVLEDGVQLVPGDAFWCLDPPHKPPCGEWTRREFEAICISNRVRVGDNCYSNAALAGVTANMAECQSAGHRGVQAHKSWHGSLGYMDPDRGGCDVQVGDPITETPSGTKYITARFRVSAHHTATYNSTVTGPATDDIWVVEHTYTLDQTVSVDRLTGVIAIPSVGPEGGLPGCTFSDVWTVHHTYTDESGFHDNELVESGVPGMDCEHDFAAGWWTFAALFMDLNCAGGLSSTAHYPVSNPGGFGGGWTPGQGAIMPTGTAEEFLAAVQGMFSAIDSHTYYVPGQVMVNTPFGSPYDQFPTWLDEAETYSGHKYEKRYATTGTVTTENTGFSMDFANSGSGYLEGSHGYLGGDMPGAGNYDYTFTNEFSCSYELSEEYLAETVEGEVLAMLALWDLSDDTYNIWRRDGWTTVHPLLSRDEVPYGVALPLNPIVAGPDDPDIASNYPQCDWVDPNDGRYSGSMLGQPLGAGGLTEVRTVTCACPEGTPIADIWIEGSPPALDILAATRNSYGDTVLATGTPGTDIVILDVDEVGHPGAAHFGLPAGSNLRATTPPDPAVQTIHITYMCVSVASHFHPETRLNAEPVMDLGAAAAGETTLWLQLPPDTGTLVVQRFAADGTWQFTGAVTTDYTYDATTRIVTILGTAAPEGYPTQTLALVTEGDYIRADYAVTQVVGGHFDWRHVTPKFWYDEVYSDPPVYRRDFNGHGAYSGGAYGIDPTDTVQPWNATQWTGGDPVSFNSDGRFLPHGAFILWRQGSEDCWMQKMAEVKMPWRSQNWFGPCGSDRDVMQDQTCADNETSQWLRVLGREGVSLTPSGQYSTNPMMVGFPLNTDNRILSWAWSSPPSDPVPTPPNLDPNCPFLAVERWGMVNGTATLLHAGELGTDYTVGSVVPGLDPLYWYAEILPGGNLFPEDDSGNTCKRTGGTHAWPDAWPIEGDRLVTLVQGTGDDAAKVIATMDREAEYLRVGDLVSFTKDWASGLTTDTIKCDDNGGAGWPVTDVDVEAKTFKFTATLTSLTNYDQITRVRSVVGGVNAPAYWWYDTDGKGTFLAVTHRTNNRDIADGADANYGTSSAIRYAQTQVPLGGMPQNVDEYTVTQGALTFDRCRPAVMCYSPNYDADDPDTIDKFEHGITYGFGTPTRDTRFGSSWHGVFIQAVTDLWYIAPQAPCVADSFLEDDPTCAPTECAWTEDDGTGLQEDLCFEGLAELGLPSGVRLYPRRPLVEARNGVPTWAGSGTAPTSDRHLDAVYPLLSEMNASLTHGTIVVPPVNAGPSAVQDIWDTPSNVWATYNAAFAQWGYWLNMQSAICRKDDEGNPTPGRWVEDGEIADVPNYRYRGYKNILGCWMCGDEPTP